MNPYYILENYLNECDAERFYGKFVDYDFEVFQVYLSYGLDATTGQSNRGEPNLYAFVL